MTEYDKPRRHRRYSTPDIPGSFVHSVDAQVLNISLAGIAVRTATQLSVGREYLFQLGQGADLIHLSGPVKWCRLSGTQKLDEGDVVPVYEAGIVLDEVFSEKAAELLQFLRRNVIVVDLRPRILGRFNLASEDPATLESKEDFVVKQLSLSGMLIAAESMHEPEAVLELEIRLNEELFRSRGRIVHVGEAAISVRSPNSISEVPESSPFPGRCSMRSSRSSRLSSSRSA